MMQAFIAPLAELAEYQEILQKRRKEKGILQIAGCVNSQIGRASCRERV